MFTPSSPIDTSRITIQHSLEIALSSTVNNSGVVSLKLKIPLDRAKYLAGNDLINSFSDKALYNFKVNVNARLLDK